MHVQVAKFTSPLDNVEHQCDSGAINLFHSLEAGQGIQVIGIVVVDGLERINVLVKFVGLILGSHIIVRLQVLLESLGDLIHKWQFLL
jgi:hypothetical protein